MGAPVMVIRFDVFCAVIAIAFSMGVIVTAFAEYWPIL